MPSLLHEALVMLFRNRPTLAPELLRDALQLALPDHDEVQLQEADLSQITPTEYEADLVVLLRSDAPVHGIVVEVQLGRDEAKRYSWPLYAAALRARLRCPTCVLVVAPDAGVARWAGRPIETGQPGCAFVPLVLGPESVPRVTDPEEARRAPEAAVLSVQAHGRDEEALDVVVAALQAASELSDERGMLYCDLVWLAVGAAVRGKLEELMANGTYTYQSDFARKYIAEGEERGLREAVLAVLEERFGAVPEALAGAVRQVQDPAVLGQLHRQAIRVPSLAAFEQALGQQG